jgi:predicted DCC family thiol-disulfide oxidoreductase YuxK
MSRPVLVYDGECGFCRRWAERWRSSTGAAVTYVPYQEAAARHPDVPLERFERSIQWFGPGKERAEGAEAAFRALATAPGRGGWLWAYRNLPGFAGASEAVYRLVAPRRVLFSRLDLLLWGRSVAPPSHRAGFWLMLRLLGLVQLSAFLSLWVQVGGLYGSEGILPIKEYLELARAHLGAAAPWRLPGVFWLSSSNAALQAACAAGAACGLLAACGLAVGPALLGCWAIYVSFLSAGREFMSFQWDILLVEITFLAAFSAPWTLKPRLERWSPPAAGLWLLRLLLFKLMVESGAVKLAGGDPTWRGLTALTYHYQTQPLPVWTSWYAHHLPVWLHKASCAVMFAVELALPPLIFLPRRPRLAAFFGLTGLMALIAATGNYCFFNLLGMLLCLTLVDDCLAPLAARKLVPALEKAAPRRWAWPFFAVVAVLYVVKIPALQPFHLVNHYGLFAMMTTTRPEIILEGSADGADWKPYEFKWKPGDLHRRPRFVAPHQPRLDWQMWFAALGDCRGNEWLIRFMSKLLEGSATAGQLLAVDPFHGGPPPQYIRSTVYDYEFTKPGEKGWWTRKSPRPYCPIFKRD